MKNTNAILESAKSAVFNVANLSTSAKNEALLAIADALEEERGTVLAANARDVEAARGSLSEAMIDRLTLTEARIAGMAKGIREVVALDDPIGKVAQTIHASNGLLIEKTVVPLGVVAIIYESRPNVTSDALALTLKSGNVCVLRGGKEAFQTSKAIVDVAKKVLEERNINENAVNLIEDTTRRSAEELMVATGQVDLLIPRGGAGLISSVVENAKVPCIQTGTGICHVFVDESANFEMALNVIENAKTSRPSVCNAMEVLLVHKNIAESFLPKLMERLPQVQLRCDETSAAFFKNMAAMVFKNTTSEGSTFQEAGEADFDTEFLDYTMAVAVVENVEAATAHIAKHSTHHSEAILTESAENAEFFIKNVDSAAVYVNASTRFTDGGEFGMGCEMGIATQKLHARGPFGLNELTTHKFVIHGAGQIRV